MILVKCDTQKNIILLGACIDVFIYITQVFEIVIKTINLYHLFIFRHYVFI